MKFVLCFIAVIVGATRATSDINELSSSISASDGVRRLLVQDEPGTHLRGSGDVIKIVPDELIRIDAVTGGIPVAKVAEIDEFDNFGVPVSRTATGGFVNTIMVALTIFAFLGNGAFMVYVFWLSK